MGSNPSLGIWFYPTISSVFQFSILIYTDRWSYECKCKLLKIYAKSDIWKYFQIVGAFLQ